MEQPFRYANTHTLLTRAFWPLLLLALSVGCIPRGRLAYFQSQSEADTIFHPPHSAYKLQPGDVLSIKYTGPDMTALQPFGQENTPQTGVIQVNAPSGFLAGYSVSDLGNIFLPVLGVIKVGNGSVSEAERAIQTRLEAFTKGAVVKLRLISFKIAVLGEVRSPGTYYIYNERITLPEALSYAGDLTDIGNRRHLRLIRTRQGVVTVTTIDLTDRRLLGSPLYFMQPNDVLYVEPLPAKIDRLNLPTISFGISLLTTALVLVNILTR